MAELDLYHNPRFIEFQKRLEDAGYRLSGMWSCKTGHHNPDTGKPYRYDNLAMFQVTAKTAGQKAPVHALVIIQNWGRDGFGVFLDSLFGKYEEGIKEIVEGIA